jgi:hypothetical protein
VLGYRVVFSVLFAYLHYLLAAYVSYFIYIAKYRGKALSIKLLYILYNYLFFKPFKLLLTIVSILLCSCFSILGTKGALRNIIESSSILLA